VIAGFGPRGKLPSSSLSLPLPFLLSSARAPCAPLVASRPAALRARAQAAWRPRAPAPSRRGGGPVPQPPRPRPAPWPRVPGGLRPSGRALLRRVPRIPARVTVFARCLTFGLFNFKFGLVDVLRRALRHATIHFKFAFIHVLRHALRRATIHFNFRLFNVWRRASSRSMFRFKFNLDDVYRRALRHAILDVIFIINSSVSWRTPSRDESFYS
jgi:hypothetical protein